MADIRVQTLADALGVPTMAAATLTAQVFEGLLPVVRVAGELVTFPEPAELKLTGAPGETFPLYVLPPGLYWRIAVRTGLAYALTRNVVLPAGSGPFDFADLVDVDPTTALPPAPFPTLADATVAATITDGPLTGAALDAEYATLAALALKAPLASPAFTGDPTAPTPATSDNDTSIATTAFVKAQGYAPLASPALTGNPTAPTPTAGDNDTSIATTGFVGAALTSKADLVGGLVPTSQIPGVALTTGQAVASRAAMLALTGVQQGDVVSITATADKGTYILGAGDPTVFGSWLMLSVPTDVVASVNGQQGVVVLAKGDIGLGSVDNTADSAKPVSTAQQAALDLKAPLANIISPSPIAQIAQIPVGRVVIYISVGEGVLITLNTFGIAQMEGPDAPDIRSLSATDKGLPAGVSAGGAAGAAKIVKFQGSYYMQAKASGVAGIYQAAPIANPGTFTWSSALQTLGTYGDIIGTGLACDAEYLYWVSYTTVPQGTGVARELRRFNGSTWTTIDLSPYFARHVHGVFPDPYNPGTVYITGGDIGSAAYVIRSTDYGATWTPIITTPGWQCVQLSFDAEYVWAGADTSSHFTAYRFDRETVTPVWASYKTHRLMPVPAALPPRRVTDLATTSASSTVTSATAAFTSSDVGSRIRVEGQDVIPIDAYILSVTNSTTIVVSKSALETASGRTAIFGGSAWGAMAYYGAVDPDTGIYYFVSINGAVGGNVNGLFALMPNGDIVLLGVLTTPPDGTGVIINGGFVWVNGFRLPLLDRI